MSPTDNDPQDNRQTGLQTGQATESLAGQPGGILAWIDGESERLRGLLPRLEGAAMELTEELADADVIRRHVILHPDRFSPHERDVAVEKAHQLGERRQRAEVLAHAAREQLQLCEAVGAGVRALEGELEGRRSPGADSRRPPPTQTLAIFQALEAERLRIARELHDGPARILADLVLKAEILDRMAKRTPEALPKELDDFKTLVRQAVADMRRFMFDLRPDSLDELGLVPTMRRYADEYQERTGIRCTFTVTGEELPIGAELSDAIFRIVQEALTNILKHARASTAGISLVIEPGRVLLGVVDDGGGFTADAGSPAARSRLGIVGMRERALAVGGQLGVISGPGEGTRVEGEFPVRS